MITLLKQFNHLSGLKLKFNYNVIVIYLKLYYFGFLKGVSIDFGFILMHF